MDRLKTGSNRKFAELEQEIRSVMREQGIEYDEAEVIVGMRRGELYGDVLFTAARRAVDPP